MATTTGTLIGRISSTAARPTVCYAAEYTASRADGSKTASVRLTVSAWLNSDSATLGTGIKLTVFGRINGSAWQSAVLKSLTGKWSDTAKHTASLTLSDNTTEETTKIEFYISRTGSSYSGSAGILGSSANPESFSVHLPVYTAVKTAPTPPANSSTDTSEAKLIHLRVDGVWKTAVPYVKVNGAWKKTIAYVKTNGVWKST